MQIGSFSFTDPVLLAPMAGVTDRPFRSLCRRLGAALASSEMASADPRVWHTAKSRKRLDIEGEMSPRSVQIAGADPAMLAEAARYNVAHGADIIDINMGCPAKKVCNALAGSALLRDEVLVGHILEAVVNAVEVPVTLKIRTGWSPDRRNGVQVARIAEQSGIQALAVHGRTRACAYRGEAEYDTIRAIKQAISIPVIANGDITSPEKARQVLNETGADAVMIGRAAQGWPWIFREIHHYLVTGEKRLPPSSAEICAVLLEHLDGLYAFYGEHNGVRIARKHLGWYSKNRAEAGTFWGQVNQLESAAEQLALTEAFFTGQLAQHKVPFINPWETP